MTAVLTQAPAHEPTTVPQSSTKRADSSVLLFAYYFPPITSAGVFRTLRFVKYLPEFGWRPIVVTVHPDKMRERRDPALLDQVPSETPVEQTSVFFPERWLSGLLSRKGASPGAASNAGSGGESETATPASTGDGGFRRMLRAIRDLAFFTPDERVWWLPSAVRAGLRAVRQYDPKVIYTTGPPHSSHLIGLILRRLTGLPWVADFRDPWSRQPWGKKKINPWGQGLLPLFEALCVHYASTVVLNTPRMADEFRAFHGGERASKFVSLPNGFDPELRAVVRELVVDAGHNRSTGPLRLCHAGSLYHRRSAYQLLVALRLLLDRGIDVHFEQIGSCDDPAGLNRQVAELKLEPHVTVAAPVPHLEALRRMARSDVLVLIQPGNELQVPGKLYEMMLFGKPILSLVDEGAVADIVANNGLGEVAASGDVEQIAAAITRISLQDRATLPTEGARRASITKFDGRELTGRLAETLTDVALRFGTDDQFHRHGSACTADGA